MIKGFIMDNRITCRVEAQERVRGIGGMGG